MPLEWRTHKWLDKNALSFHTKDIACFNRVVDIQPKTRGPVPFPPNVFLSIRINHLLEITYGDMRCTRYHLTRLGSTLPTTGRVGATFHLNPYTILKTNPEYFIRKCLSVNPSCPSLNSINPWNNASALSRAVLPASSFAPSCFTQDTYSSTLNHKNLVYSHIERHMGVHPHTSWPSMKYVGGWIPLGGIHHYTSDTPQSHHAANRRNRQSQSHA